MEVMMARAKKLTDRQLRALLAGLPPGLRPDGLIDRALHQSERLAPQDPRVNPLREKVIYDFRRIVRAYFDLEHTGTGAAHRYAGILLIPITERHLGLADPVLRYCLALHEG